MARMMSLIFVIFLMVPAIAPSIGEAILQVGDWRAIFGAMAVLGVVMGSWVFIRLPESLTDENRQPIEIRSISRNMVRALALPSTFGYVIGSALVFGALFGFINSSQQIFADVFDAEAQFPAVFALIAGGIAVASLVNARWVVKLGSRRISHTALLGFTTIAAVHAAVALSGHESIWTFAVLQTLTMFCFGLIAGNFGSMAMETMGKIAGTAASIQGFISTIVGSLLGFAVGQQFNGTTIPMSVGFTLFGLVALGWVLFAERGRLFRAHHAPVAAKA